MCTNLSLTLHLENLTIIISSWFLLTCKNLSKTYQWLAHYRSGQMTRMLCYMTVLLAQTEICFGIHPMALRSTLHYRLHLYVHMPTRSHGLQATSALSKNLKLLLSRSETLIRILIRNPAMPSDEPSNRQSINTGLRLNPTTLALTLVAKACKLLRITKGYPTMSCPVAKAYQTS